MRRHARPRAATLAGLVLPGVLLSLVLACSDSPGPTTTPGAARAATDATTVTFPAADGMPLDGRLFTPAEGTDRLIVLLHMYSTDQTAWFEAARHLSELGFAALTFDFRGYGTSGGEQDAGAAVTDLEGALAWAAAQGFQRVALVGASMGGTAAIVAAGQAAEAPPPLSVDGVFTLSAPAEFLDLDAEAVVGSIAVPLWTLAAEGDTSAAHAVESFAERADLDTHHRYELPGAEHGTDLIGGEHRDEVYTLLGEFLRTIWPENS